MAVSEDLGDLFTFSGSFTEFEHLISLSMNVQLKKEVPLAWHSGLGRANIKEKVEVLNVLMLKLILQICRSIYIEYLFQ